MSRRAPLLLVTGCLLVALLSTVACAPSDPIEQIAKTRQEYTVKLNQFLVQDPPMPEPAPVETMGEESAASAAEAAVADEETAGEEGEDIEDGFDLEPVGPQPKNILFDLIVGFDGSDPLPGLTVEVSQIDPFQEEKATFRHYLDLGSLQSGTTQTDFVLENVMYEDGDGFSVDLRLVVPPEERGEYREFATAGP